MDKENEAHEQDSPYEFGDIVSAPGVSKGDGVTDSPRVERGSRRRSSFAGKGILRATEVADSTWPPVPGVLDGKLDDDRAFGNEIEDNGDGDAQGHQKKQSRKSLGRRVSFAPRAHVRPFTKDSDKADMPSPNQRVFTIPDLSSIRRTSGHYDIQLSPGSDLKGEHRDTSYEIDLAPPAAHPDSPLHRSHNDFSIDALAPTDVGNANTNPPPLSSDPQGSASPAKSSKRRRKSMRDSIAGFFDNTGTGPKQLRNVLTDITVQGPDFANDEWDDASDDDSEMDIDEETENEQDAEDVTRHDERDQQWPGYPTADVHPANPAEVETPSSAGELSMSMDLEMSLSPKDSVAFEAVAESQDVGGRYVRPQPVLEESGPESSVIPIKSPRKSPRQKKAPLRFGEWLSPGPSVSPAPNTGEKGKARMDDSELSNQPLAKRFKHVDDTIAGFFPREFPSAKQQPTVEKRAEIRVQADDQETARSSAAFSRLSAADDKDDTIGRFFKTPEGGNASENGLDADSSSEDDVGGGELDMEMTMDITRCVGRGILAPLPDEDDNTANTVETMLSATPTQSFAQRRRESLRSRRSSSASTPSSRQPVEASPFVPITELKGLLGDKKCEVHISEPVPRHESNVKPSPRKPPSTRSSNIDSPAVKTHVESPAEPAEDLDDAGSFIGDQNFEDDIMNEPSMVEESFMEEAKSITSVREFLQATGIYFQDSLTTGFRRESQAYLHTEKPTDLEYYTAALVWSCELDTYEFGCTELQKIIDDVREEITHAEAEAAANPPPIFFDACEGTVNELTEIQRQLKAARSFTRTEAKEYWHAWRSQHLDNLVEFFTAHLEFLRKDWRKIQRMASRVSDMNTNGEKVVADLRRQVEETRQRVQNEEKEVTEKLRALNEEREEQQEQIAQIRAECDRLRQLCDEEQIREQQLANDKIEMTNAIRKAEDICRDLMIFDPVELATLRDEYKLLATMFSWTSSHASPSKHVLIYDQVIQVALTKVESNKLHVELSVVEEPKSSYHYHKVLSTIKQHESHPTVAAFGRAKIANILRREQDVIGLCGGPADIGRVMTHVANVWNTLRDFHNEVEVARDEYLLDYADNEAVPFTSPHPTRQQSSPIPFNASVAVTTSIFCRQSRTRFRVAFGVPVAPSGALALAKAWASEAQVIYGRISFEQVGAVVAEELEDRKRQASTPSTSGKLLRALRRLEHLAAGR
ncbi:Spc7 kinetochore protein-domain-containing protein [Fimicolochytrium jonesii]|uniref:Spc7 kinetochore protein-domain-containing protein n=1 Tax=Fimicolochytrium jonesii TaxID=1396493 RepID=UPI0022FE518C|nr:Spc7 kinetochore protein-domain-containing protein [Fimicolochytrium jonesii]KAI8826095.1 Spc7 kinetochore protein-domain-containing protein [Fimicolochytrium jonesii]